MGTNPENRRLMKLGSLIESGNGGVFDVIEFYNTIQSSRKHIEKKTSGCSEVIMRKKKIMNHHQQARPMKGYCSIEIIEHQKILKQHSSIKFGIQLKSISRN